jgi:hypothetical protein
MPGACLYAICDERLEQPVDSAEVGGSGCELRSMGSCNKDLI